MTTKLRADLDEVWARLKAGLSNLDNQPPPGPARARTMRLDLTKYLTGLADNAEGRRKARCPQHPTEWEFNCGVCRSERDGRAPGEPPNPAALPPTPDGVAAEEERRFGGH